MSKHLVAVSDTHVCPSFKLIGVRQEGFSPYISYTQQGYNSRMFLLLSHQHKFITYYCFSMACRHSGSVHCFQLYSCFMLEVYVLVSEASSTSDDEESQARLSGILMENENLEDDAGKDLTIHLVLWSRVFWGFFTCW